MKKITKKEKISNKGEIIDTEERQVKGNTKTLGGSKNLVAS